MFRLDENNTLVASDAAGGFLYGYGICTTFVLKPGIPVFLLEKHYERLVEGCAFLNLAMPWETMDAFESVVNHLRDMHDKPVVARLSMVADGTLTEIIQSHPIPVSVWLSFRDRPTEDHPVLAKSVCYQRPFPQIKHINYLGEVLLMRQAKIEGFNELLRITTDGRLSEFSTANAFVVSQGDTVITPSLETDQCLAGTTRDLIIRGCRELNIAVEERSIHLSELQTMKGMFLSNAVRGVRAISRVDEVRFDSKRIEPLLDALRSHFRLPDRL